MTYPLLSDTRREMSRAYESLQDAPAKLGTAEAVNYLRSKRSWFVIDKQGIIRYMRVEANNFVLPTDELLEVVKKYQ